MSFGRLRVTVGCLIMAEVVGFAMALQSASVLATESLEAEDKTDEKPHWSDVVKDIPVGPFRLDLGANLRLRYEYESNFDIQRYADDRKATYAEDGFLLHRERLDLKLHLSETAHLFVQFQNNDVFDSDFTEKDFSGSSPYTNLLNVRQAYAEWLHIGGSPFGLKVGRQAISYGDTRIWSPGEWGNTGRYTWDAVKVIADFPFMETHLILANRVRYDPHAPDKRDPWLDVYAAYAMIKNLPFKLDLFWTGKHTDPDMAINAQGDLLDLDTDTLGFYMDGKIGKRWDWRGTLAYTIGDRKLTTYKRTQDSVEVKITDEEVDAWGLNARLGYTFDASWKPRVGIEFSYGSGDSTPTDHRYGTFDGAFGAVDAFYGWMNLVGWMNLEDYQASFSCQPTKKLTLAADHHLYRLDETKDAWYYFTGQAIRRYQKSEEHPIPEPDADLGHEINFIVTYKHSKHLELQAGYAHFWPGKYIKETGPSPDADWCFVQTTYSF